MCVFLILHLNLISWTNFSLIIFEGLLKISAFMLRQRRIIQLERAVQALKKKWLVVLSIGWSNFVNLYYRKFRFRCLFYFCCWAFHFRRSFLVFFFFFFICKSFYFFTIFFLEGFKFFKFITLELGLTIAYFFFFFITYFVFCFI